MKINEVNLGKAIYDLLCESGKSKGEFADNLGIKRQNINRDVFSKHSLDTSLLCRISEYFDCNLFTLFCEDNQKDYSRQEVKVKIIIEMGAEKQEKSATFIFGENKVELDNF